MKKIIFAALIILGAVSVRAQHMFDYSDIRAGKFTQKSVSGLRPMADGEHYTVIEDGKIEKYSYKTGDRVSTVADIRGIGETIGRVADYQFSPDEKKLLLSTGRIPIYRHSFTARFWIHDLSSGTTTEVAGRDIQEPVFSPDGTKMIYVYENNLYVTDLVTGKESCLTSDGQHGHIINGHADWVYEEEFGFTRAFEISPCGRFVGYMKFDESEVPEVTITRFTGELYPEPLTFKYPKPGEKNSVVTLHIADLQSGETRKINCGPETDQYIPRIGWTPDGRFFFYRSNRLQNQFELLLAGNDGSSEVIYEEKDPKYIERPDADKITFLPKGDKFVVTSERSGFRHLYVHTIGKPLQIDTLTRGNFEVTKLVDISPDRVYFLSNEGSTLRNNFYSVKLNGKGKTRLTEEEGNYRISPSTGCKYFISYFSNISTPNVVRVHNNAGKVLRVLEDNEELFKRIDAIRIPRKEFIRITTERGTVLNAYIIKPRDFDPSKKYPVMMTQYSGPGSQQVLDRWSMDWTDVLVQEGYIVLCVDGRGTGGRGAAFRNVTYAILGGPETEDQISAAKYIATQPYVDMSRIGIYGWSFGGYMALNCILKGADVFNLAIAVAPVTSWRFYDTIYTEIYNGLPQDNPKGYDQYSPLGFAENLKGKLLIIHGSADDNVHFQNAMAMAAELIKADKKFDMFVYPDDNHSMVPTGRHHIMQQMIDYTLRNL